MVCRGSRNSVFLGKRNASSYKPWGNSYFIYSELRDDQVNCTAPILYQIYLQLPESTHSHIDVHELSFGNHIWSFVYQLIKAKCYYIMMLPISYEFCSSNTNIFIFECIWIHSTCTWIFVCISPLFSKIVEDGNKTEEKYCIWKNNKTVYIQKQ